MKLYRFTEHGLSAFADYLSTLSKVPNAAVPGGLLTAPQNAELLSPGIDIDSRVFANRMEAASYLDGVLSQVSGADLQRDVRLWSWLTLFYFDQACPIKPNGDRIVGAQRAKWIPEVEESRRFYRHAVLGPYLAYRAHRDSPGRASVLLSDPMHVTTSEAFRLFIETTFINMKGPVELATEFYFNPATRKLRRGAGTKRAGGLRRYIGVLQQLDVTFDLHRLAAAQLKRLLPSEFNKWAAQ
jgi:hypothetical protein